MITLLKYPQKKKKKSEDIPTSKIRDLQTELAVVILSRFPNYARYQGLGLPEDPRIVISSALPSKMTLTQVLESELYIKASSEPAVDFLVSSVVGILRSLNKKKPADRDAREVKAASILSQIAAKEGEINARFIISRIYQHFNLLVPYKYRQNGQNLQGNGTNGSGPGQPLQKHPEIPYPVKSPNRRRPQSPRMAKHGRGLITTILPILEKKASE